MKFLIVTPKIAIYMAVVSFVLTGNNITAVYVFIVTSFCDNLKLSLAVSFIFGMANQAETRVSIKRLQELLLLEELNHNDTNVTHNHVARKQHENPLVELQDDKAKWLKNATDFTLNGVTLRIEGHKVIGLVGPVGGGKSSIFHAILNELVFDKGSINIRGSISYASQEAWIFTGNICQNILFGKPMKKERYSEVLKICALERDLSILPYGDQTLVGERGVILSGGQKARVNLARALYADADIYLLDDPFAAVDAHVVKHLFEQCIKKFLSQKCTILITHQTQYIGAFDCAYLVEGGKIITSGKDPELHVHRPIGLHNLQLIVPDNKQTYCTMFKSEDTIALEHIDDGKPSNIEEHRNTGGIVKGTVKAYLTAADSTAAYITLASVFLFSQLAFTASDYFVAFWVNDELQRSDDIYKGSLSEVGNIYIYTGLVILMTITTMLRSYLLFKLCTEVSIGLHNKMFTSIINAPMKFFHLNNSGRILNRFTKDMGIIDESIPLVLIEFFQISLTCIGIVVVICITNPYLIIGAVIICVVFYYIRAMYMPTGLSLKRLEATARSPIYGYINETLQGLSTIRASKSQLILQREFDKHQDYHSSVFFCFTTCTKAFGLYMDIVCICFLALVTVTMLLSHSVSFFVDHLKSARAVGKGPK